VSTIVIGYLADYKGASEMIQEEITYQREASRGGNKWNIWGNKRKIDADIGVWDEMVVRYKMVRYMKGRLENHRTISMKRYIRNWRGRERKIEVTHKKGQHGIKLLRGLEYEKP
jgi:hypothetical protein